MTKINLDVTDTFWRIDRNLIHQYQILLDWDIYKFWCSEWFSKWVYVWHPPINRYLTTVGYGGDPFSFYSLYFSTKKSLRISFLLKLFKLRIFSLLTSRLLLKRFSVFDLDTEGLKTKNHCHWSFQHDHNTQLCPWESFWWFLFHSIFVQSKWTHSNFPILRKKTITSRTPSFTFSYLSSNSHTGHSYLWLRSRCPHTYPRFKTFGALVLRPFCLVFSYITWVQFFILHYSFTVTILLFTHIYRSILLYNGIFVLNSFLSQPLRRTFTILLIRSFPRPVIVSVEVKWCV